jgi:hypothetical protein
MSESTVSNLNFSSCIETCLQCHQACLHIAMTHCLETGGDHVQAEHFRLMMNCAEICQTAANFMLSQSPLHVVVCAACAEVCIACADSCEQIGDMEECVNTCHRCAQQCESMGKGDGYEDRDYKSTYRTDGNAYS